MMTMILISELLLTASIVAVVYVLTQYLMIEMINHKSVSENTKEYLKSKCIFYRDK